MNIEKKIQSALIDKGTIYRLAMGQGLQDP